MRGFIVNLIASAIALYVADYLLDGIRLAQGGDTQSNIVTVLIVAFIFGLINALIKPIISLLSLPITILTLGLFALIINAAMLMLAGFFSGGRLTVDGWITAILGSIIISIVSTIVGSLLSDKDD
jgi:putative membrane protein